MERWTWARALLTLGAIVVVTLCAGAVDLSGTGGYTLTLWQPVTLHAGLDLGGGGRVLLQARPVAGESFDDRTMEEARRIITNRIGHGSNLTEPSIRTLGSGSDRYIDVAWAGSKADAPALQDLVQQRGQLTIVGIVGATPEHPIMKKCGKTGPSTKIRDLTGDSARGYPVLARDGDVIPGSVAVGLDTLKGSPVVDAALTAPAASRVAAAPFPFLGVAIDDKIYDVRIKPHLLPLGNQFQMTNTTGSICVTTLTTTTISLVTKLKYGVLPVALRTVDVRDAGPTLQLSNPGALGAAALAALALAALIVVVRFRLTGALAVAALLVDALVTLAIVKLAVLTLTLAGLAGFALAIALAADAQHIIIRRMREEARAAREGPPLVALADGVARAWPAIRDTGAVILIACALLWWVGATGAMDALTDFATMLFIGVAVSMVVARVVSPTVLSVMARGHATTGSVAASGASATGGYTSGGAAGEAPA